MNSLSEAMTKADMQAKAGAKPLIDRHDSVHA